MPLDKTVIHKLFNENNYIQAPNTTGKPDKIEDLVDGSSLLLPDEAKSSALCNRDHYCIIRVLV